MPTEARSSDFARPSFADPYSGRIVLLSDDLTGACDAGAAFLRSGRTVRVWFGTSVQFSTPESVQAFNTSSRVLSPRRAARAVSLAVTALAGDPNSLFFKKVDSAARGPLGAEVARSASGARNTRHPVCSCIPRRGPHRERRHPSNRRCSGKAFDNPTRSPVSDHGPGPHLPRLACPRTCACP